MVKRILVGADGSECSDRAIRFAAELATPLGAELTVAHVVMPIDFGAQGYPEVLVAPEVLDEYERQARLAGEKLLGRAAETARAAGASAARTELLVGPPPAQLAHLAETGGYDLVVVGSRGHGVVKRALMGSTSDRLAHLSHRPVLVVH